MQCCALGEPVAMVLVGLLGLFFRIILCGIAPTRTCRESLGHLDVWQGRPEPSLPHTG